MAILHTKWALLSHSYTWVCLLNDGLCALRVYNSISPPHCHHPNLNNMRSSHFSNFAYLWYTFHLLALFLRSFSLEQTHRHRQNTRCRNFYSTFFAHGVAGMLSAQTIVGFSLAWCTLALALMVDALRNELFDVASTTFRHSLECMCASKPASAQVFACVWECNS